VGDPGVPVKRRRMSAARFQADQERSRRPAPVREKSEVGTVVAPAPRKGTPPPAEGGKLGTPRKVAATVPQSNCRSAWARNPPAADQVQPRRSRTPTRYRVPGAFHAGIAGAPRGEPAVIATELAAGQTSEATSAGSPLEVPTTLLPAAIDEGQRVTVRDRLGALLLLARLPTASPSLTAPTTSSSPRPWPVGTTSGRRRRRPSDRMRPDLSEVSRVVVAVMLDELRRGWPASLPGGPSIHHAGEPRARERQRLEDERGTRPSRQVGLIDRPAHRSSGLNGRAEGLVPGLARREEPRPERARVPDTPCRDDTVAAMGGRSTSPRRRTHPR